MFYVGPSEAPKVRMSISTLKGEVVRDIPVQNLSELDPATASRVGNTDKNHTYGIQKPDGTCSYFSPVDVGGVLVAYSKKPDSDSILKASIH
jgi:hypothetical protein